MDLMHPAEGDPDNWTAIRLLMETRVVEWLFRVI